MAALRVWAGPDAEKTVIEGSRHASFMVRGEAIPALAKFKTAAAAEAAAAQAAHNQREVGSGDEGDGSRRRTGGDRLAGRTPISGFAAPRPTCWRKSAARKAWRR